MQIAAREVRWPSIAHCAEFGARSLTPDSRPLSTICIIGTDTRRTSRGPQGINDDYPPPRRRDSAGARHHIRHRTDPPKPRSPSSSGPARTRASCRRRCSSLSREAPEGRDRGARIQQHDHLPQDGGDQAHHAGPSAGALRLLQRQFHHQGRRRGHLGQARPGTCPEHDQGAEGFRPTRGTRRRLHDVGDRHSL